MEFHSLWGKNSTSEKIISVMSIVAQLIASIPDKARARASSSLSPKYPLHFDDPYTLLTHL